MRSDGIKNKALNPMGAAKPAVAGAKALPAKPLSADNLIKLTKGLALGFPDRVFGTATGKQSAEWMAAQFKAIGLEPWDGGSFLQEFEWDIDGAPTPGFNVGGVMRGTDPKLADEFIIVTAHHDSQADTRVGANDNATGCAGVLAIAQEMAKNPPKRSVLFMTFDGEEGMKVNNKYQWGRRGSKHYAKNPMVPLAKTALLLNMDMIGQVHLEAGSRNQIHQWASRDSFAQQVLNKASKATLQPGEEAISGYPEQHDQAQMFSTDAEPLYRLGIPTVNFLSGRDLDNHAPEDDMTRIIPERIAQYATLAHQCTVEAANHPESVQQMGITPGGLMPSYSMIRAAKSAGSRVPEEEQLRLDDHVARMPAFKEAAASLVAQLLDDPELSKTSGIDLAKLAKTHGGLAKEPALHEVRTLHAELADAMHSIKKGDVGARKTAQARLQAVQGIEDVLAGAIYVGKIEKTGNYYMQQVPARLADLNRGARRLGLDAKLEGVVFDKDIVAFAPTVSADRAMHIAKETLAGLGKEVGIAAYALLAPSKAALDERPADHKDLAALGAGIEDAARAVVGDAAVDGGGCQPMAMQAALTAQLAGLKGSPKKWADGFAAKNAFTDFTQFIEQLQLPKADAQRLIDKAHTMQGEASQASIVEFYKDLTGVTLGQGQQIQTLDELRGLARPEAVQELLQQASGAAQNKARDAVVNLAQDDAQVAGLQKLSTLMTAALDLSAMFDKDKHSLASGKRLSEVQTKISAVIDACEGVSGAEPVAAELSNWSQWLTPFLGLEGRAKEQARGRTAAAKEGNKTVSAAWKTFAADLKELGGAKAKAIAGSAAKTHAALTELAKANEEAGERKDAALERLIGRVEVFKTVETAVRRLAEQPSPEAEAQLKASLPKFELYAGDRAGKELQRTIGQLDHLHQLDDVQMGRQNRGGPLSVVAVRAAFDGKVNR